MTSLQTNAINCTKDEAVTRIKQQPSGTTFYVSFELVMPIPSSLHEEGQEGRYFPAHHTLKISRNDALKIAKDVSDVLLNRGGRIRCREVTGEANYSGKPYRAFYIG